MTTRHDQHLWDHALAALAALNEFRAHMESRDLGGDLYAAWRTAQDAVFALRRALPPVQTTPDREAPPAPATPSPWTVRIMLEGREPIDRTGFATRGDAERFARDALASGLYNTYPKGDVSSFYPPSRIFQIDVWVQREDAP